MAIAASYGDLPFMTFVPEGYRNPYYYFKVIDELGVFGYESIGLSLSPAISRARPLENFDLDVVVTRSAIERCTIKGKDSVLFMLTYAAYKHVSSTYIFTEKDNAFIIEVQQYIVNVSGGKP